MKNYFWCILFFFIAYLAVLGCRPLVAPDEYRYGEIAREMIERSDWVVPRLLGVRYFEKPVMAHWLNAFSIKVFGENAFALRFSSALLTGLTAAVLALLVRQVKNEPRLAALTGAVYLATGLVMVVGTTALTDAPLGFFSTTAWALILLASFEERWNRRRLVLLLTGGVVLGCGILTKGFVALVVPGISLAGFLIWQKRWRDLVTLPWLPLAVALAVVLPWGIAIHRAEPDFWRYFIVEEHWQRFTQNNPAQHPKPWYFLLPIFLGAGFPAFLLLPTALSTGTKCRSALLREPLLRASLCAVVLPLIFFSACSGKLATYLLPCYGPLAILIAAGVAAALREKPDNRIFRWTLASLGWLLLVAGVITLAGGVLARPLFPAIFPDLRTLPGALLPMFATAGAAALIAGSALIHLCRKSWKWQLGAFFAAPALLMAAINGMLPDAINPAKMPEKTYRAFAARGALDPRHDMIISYGGFAYAAAWHFRRSDVRMLTPGELSYGADAARLKHEEPLVYNGHYFTSLIRRKERPAVVFIGWSDEEPSPEKSVQPALVTVEGRVLMSRFPAAK